MANHDKEILTDNTKIHYCKQCKNCAYWGNGDVYSNAYDKSSCDIYPFPQYKPNEVVYNTGECAYWTLRVKKS